MNEMHIDHEAAHSVCRARLAEGMHPSSSDRNIARALLDLHRQLAAERARVEALCDVIHDANGIAYPFAEMQDKMTAILNAHEQGDEG